MAVTPVNPPTNALWLTVTPASGNLPASLSVRVNPTTMQVGAYSATIAVTVSGVTNPVNITVNLNVTAAPSPLTVSPGTLTFTYPSATLSQTRNAIHQRRAHFLHCYFGIGMDDGSE